MPIEELKDKYLQKIPDLSWYLIRTMPKSEQNAEAFLKMNCIPCYLPRYNRVYINSFTAKNGKKYAYKRPPVLSPMFPGYIFAALDLDTMSQTRRSRSIAQVCLYTNYTEDELVTDLHKVQDFEFLAKNNQVEVCQDLQEGKMVVIKRGVFKGWEGVVERRIDRNFIFVRIKTVGVSIGVECAAVDCDAVE